MARVYPYVSDAQFLQDAIGVDLSDIEQPERLSILRRASLQVDRYCRTGFGWRYKVDELKDWPLDDTGYPRYYGEIYPNLRPIRLVTDFQIEVGVNSSLGGPVFAAVPTTPVPPGGFGNLPPHTMGQVWIDPARGIVQPVYVLLKFGLFEALPSLALRPPSARLSYTAGYDLGTPPETAPVLGLPGPGGLIDPGSHVWAIAHLSAEGVSSCGPCSPPSIIPPGQQTMTLSAIPPGPEGTVGRLVARSKAGTAFPLYAVGRLDDNTTSVYTDSLPDAALGPMIPGDGFTLPLPDEVADATRLAAARMAGERNLNARGLRGLDQLRTGPLLARRHGPGEARLKDPLVEVFQDLLDQFRVYTVAGA